MTRAAIELRRVLSRIRHGSAPRLKDVPRPGYCHCCGAWSWLTNETPAYSAFDGAYLCEECAVENDENTRAARAEYYAGCL